MPVGLNRAATFRTHICFQAGDTSICGIDHFYQNNVHLSLQAIGSHGESRLHLHGGLIIWARSHVTLSIDKMSAPNMLTKVCVENTYGLYKSLY